MTTTTASTVSNAIVIDDDIVVPVVTIPIFLIIDDGRTVALDASFVQLSLLVASYYETSAKTTLLTHIQQEQRYLESRIVHLSTEIKKLTSQDKHTIERLSHELESVGTQYKEYERTERLVSLDQQEIATRNRIELYVPSISYNTILFLQSFGKALCCEHVYPTRKLNEYLVATPDEAMMDDVELDEGVVQALHNAMPSAYTSIKQQTELIANSIIAADALSMTLVFLLLNKYLSLMIQRELCCGYGSLGLELGITSDFTLDEIRELDIQNSFIPSTSNNT